MDTQDAASGFDQCFIITQSLCTDQGTECESFGGYLEIRGRFGGDHNKPRVRGAALVELSRRMLEARTKTSRHGITSLRTDGDTHFLKLLDNVFVARQVG